MLPFVRLEGTPTAQGRAHGEALRGRIAHNLSVYFERFAREGRLSRTEVLARAAAYGAAIRGQDADYAAAMAGVAEGAATPELEIVALNVRYEILYHQFTAQAMADGCTAFAALPEITADGHLLMGQNWDWIPEVQGAVVHLVNGDREVLAFTEAGIVGGKIGLSSEGLGLAVNGLVSTDDDWSRLGPPFHLRCHRILRAASLASATRWASEGPRSCSANFVVGQAGVGALDLETAPAGVCQRSSDGGALCHANHFGDPGAIGVTEPPVERRAQSVHRGERLARLLADGRPVTIAGMQVAMRDHDGHPHSVCRHPDPAARESEHYATVTSVVMDLDARAMWLSDGPPCAAPYQGFRLR